MHWCPSGGGASRLVQSRASCNPSRWAVAGAFFLLQASSQCSEPPSPPISPVQVSREFLNVLGQEKLAYLGLVHQLIVCEEQWAQEAHR